MRLPIILFPLCFVVGCAAQKAAIVYEPKTIVATKDGKSVTVFLNRQNTNALSDVAGNIYLDGKAVGTIRNGQCIRLIIPAGSYSVSVAKPAALFGSLGTALGTAFASAMGLYNAKAKPGEKLFFSVAPSFDLNTGWQFDTMKKPSGRSC